VTKFPLVAGLFALVFAAGSLFGVRGLGAGIAAYGGTVAPRLTDFLFWLGVMSSCLVLLTLYSLLLQKLGILEGPKQTPSEQGQTPVPLPSEPSARPLNEL
jgi:hypothetical protein